MIEMRHSNSFTHVPLWVVTYTACRKPVYISDCNRGYFWMQFFFLRCARVYKTWIMRTLPCKHKIWGEICDICSHIFLPSLFSMSLKLGGDINCPWNLEGILIGDSSRDYYVFTEIIKRFLNYHEIWRCEPNYIQKWLKKQPSVGLWNSPFSQSV